MGVADLLASARLIGFGNSARAVRSALSRSWQDRDVQFRGGQVRGGQFHGTPGTAPRLRTPGTLASAEPAPGGVRLTFSAATARICCLADGGLFVAWDDAEPLPSYALADPGHAPEPQADARLRELADGWAVETDQLAVSVDNRGAIEVSLIEPAPDGERRQLVRRDEPPWWSEPVWVHRATVDPAAAVVGLGGRSGAMDRRERRFRLWNTEPGGSFGADTDPLSITMPMYLVVGDTATHLAFYDVTYDGTVDVRRGSVTARLSDGALRYYVYAGSPASVLDRFTALTGRPALPPKWALGYHQSRWDYRSQEALRAVVDGFVEHHLPLSGLWLDIDHLEERRSFTVDEKRFPDLPGLARDLAAADGHLVTIVDPCVKIAPGTQIYDEARAADLLCRTPRGQLARGVSWPGAVVFPDFTSPDVRAWWGEHYARPLTYGVEGFWHDMNEPSSFTAFGEPTLPRSTRHELEGRGGDHREAHNVYGLLMTRAGYEGLRRLRPDRRPYLISRSGWVGMQRYGGTWSGDIESSWSGLRASLEFTLGLGLSGVPYSGPDIGGFTGYPPAELYTRWFQLAAYLPFFRTHCARTLPPREPWAYGPEVLEAVAGHLRERYRLLPYWYTLAWQAHRTGAPYVRPLFWLDPADRELRAVDDAFLVGDALLVAPVLDEGERTRSVQLPAGRWYDRRDGTAYDGPVTIEVAAPLAEVPVFARAGAVIPVAEGDRIVLEAYLPAPGAPNAAGGILISDAGDGFDEPREERFAVRLDPSGRPELTYDGPDLDLPYDVHWSPGRG